MEVISELKKPWIILGDFNAIISPEEKVGGKAPNRNSMIDFIHCLNACELLQAPKIGLQFSWSNCQQGKNRILCNLDRVVFNSLWLQLYGDWGYKVGLRVASDHAPLLGGCAGIPKPKNISWRFQRIWIDHPSFLAEVKQVWSKPIVGDPSFIFMQKLNNLKKFLNEWNWSTFVNVYTKVKEAEDNVKSAMELSEKNPFDEYVLVKLVEAQNEHASREVQANTLMKLKSRGKWITDGSANTGYFHAKMKIGQAKNLITQDVNIVEGLLDVIPSVITAEDQPMLDSIPTIEEIKETIFEMDPDGAPSPDGFSGAFYKNCWEIIQMDLKEAIQLCWRRRFIPKELKSNFLTLIPKCAGAKKENQFRTIGLSNMLFKIFIKIINARMNGLMVKLISPQHDAYIKGRSIQEQVLLDSEMVNEMKKKRRRDNVAFKLYISQAYEIS
ncbi:uncharacterized protein LOC113305566 [Papaver somniferum]|uniref:uncharacterized protein LOC113305566 n=1 Tax=Papaver somniferum TaxID=3469 RepID=UPI000E6F9026|nr:uncharacterized protein LOC113305566 [Papaver somniferum]